nr:MAG TPA: hypothetical protein [Caudoviricetes sp.]
MPLPLRHSWRRFYHNTQPKAREKLEKLFLFSRVRHVLKVLYYT